MLRTILSQDAMNNSHSGAVSPEEHFDSIYLRAGAGCRSQNSVSSVLQSTQNSFQFSFAKDQQGVSDEVIDPGQTLGIRGGPCGHSVSFAKPHAPSNAERSAESLEAKYLSQSLHQSEDQNSDIWNYPPDMEMNFQGEIFHNEFDQS